MKRNQGLKERRGSEQPRNPKQDKLYLDKGQQRLPSSPWCSRQIYLQAPRCTLGSVVLHKCKMQHVVALSPLLSNARCNPNTCKDVSG